MDSVLIPWPAFLSLVAAVPLLFLALSAGAWLLKRHRSRVYRARLVRRMHEVVR